MPEDIINTATADGEVSTEQQISTEQVETGDTAQVEQETAQETVQERQERLFKQSELDAIIEKRLAKERQRHETETKTAAQQARDSWVAEQGYVWHNKPISTEAEYKQALKEQELENKIRTQYSNVPDEVVNELVEGKRFREQYQTEKQTAEQKAAESKMYSDFLEAYPDVKPEDVPAEVWKEVKAGRNLTDAYVRYENKRLKDEMAKYQTQQQIEQANSKNAASSTGSAKTSGKTGGFISKEDFEANKHDMKWVQKNLSTLEESRRYW